MIGRAEAPSVNGQRQRVLYLLAGTLITVLLQLAAGVLGPFGMLFNLLTMVPASLACMVASAQWPARCWSFRMAFTVSR